METDRIDTGRSDNQRRQSGGEKGGMRHASLGRRCLLAACAAFLMGCLSPTLPMPPPAKPDIEGPDERGIFVLSGHVLPESHVYADNENTGFSYGQIADAVTGAYRFPILASVGDSISMFYRLNGEASTTLRFTIRAGTSPIGGAGAGAGGMPGQAGFAGASGGWDVSRDPGFNGGGASSIPAASNQAGMGAVAGQTR